MLFGEGTFARIGAVASRFGNSALLVTGGGSLERSGRLDALLEDLSRHTVRTSRVTVKGEPTPALVDGAVREHRGAGAGVVIAVGGGSVLDAGKAVSAMLPVDGSVLDYLEEVGTPGSHSGVKVPFVAVPTTAGTGSEATKNAVLSHVGPEGFKVSLRHDNFVPDVAVVDPALALTCPAATTAACGMDALTQLLESFVSPAASPLTDALALSGLERAAASLVAACTRGTSDTGARAGMAYAALVSGITLANAGLGVVHGLAGALGGLYEIPHGVACGTLVGPATRVNISRLRDSGGGSAALAKYAAAGAVLAGGHGDESVEVLCDLLVETIERWVEELGIPRLADYGVMESGLDALASSAGQKNNPVTLTEGDIRGILASRL